MDIVFVISHVPNPRMNKRIEVAKTLGKTGLIYWDRETVSIWDILHTDIKNIKINVKANYTSPLKRITPTIIFGYKAIKQLNKLKPSCIYTANIDMLIIVSLYSLLKKNKPEIIYESADLNSLIADEQKSVIKRLFKKMLIYIEKQLCKKINTLVVTSRKFYEDYYSNFVSKEKLLFIPNMPDLRAFSNFSRKKKGVFTIGFIGAIRYKDQMKMLIDAAEKTEVNVLFAGEGLDSEIEKISQNKSFVEYSGKYNYNRDISYLYGQVDAIYSVYDLDKNNVKMALPNKLYEAIHCSLPIIVSKGTYLAEIVESKRVGVAVSHNESAELERVLNKLNNDKSYYFSFVESCEKVKDEIDLNIYNIELFNRFDTILSNKN
ncbi:glycosyltransferase [Sporosarcina ureae]|uniref:glycosyltransferase n=1 Tax=Sporosarcina ureae TaxID=1571 RepID=UPI0028AFF5AA|nr:glycosyltransferase [Sporosarcina ureae]